MNDNETCNDLSREEIVHYSEGLSSDVLIEYLHLVNGPHDGHLEHYGVEGQKWGVRRYQNEDGSLTALGREHYGLDKLSPIGKNFNEKFANSDAVRMKNKLYSKIDSRIAKDRKTLLEETKAVQTEKGDEEAIRYYESENKKIAESAWTARRFVDEYINSQRGDMMFPIQTSLANLNEKQTKMEKKQARAEERMMKEAKADAERGRKEMEAIEKSEKRKEAFWTAAQVLALAGVGLYAFKKATKKSTAVTKP